MSQPKSSRSRSQRLGAFFILMLVLFNFPMLSIANVVYFLQYMPSLFLYLFIIWGLSVLMLYFLVERDNFSQKKRLK